MTLADFARAIHKEMGCDCGEYTQQGEVIAAGVLRAVAALAIERSKAHAAVPFNAYGGEYEYGMNQALSEFANELERIAADGAQPLPKGGTQA